MFQPSRQPWCKLQCFFLKWPPSRWADRAEILNNLCGIFCATFGQKNWPGQVRSRSYDVIRGTASDRCFQGNCVFSHVPSCHWLEWRYYACFRSAYEQIWPLTLHLDIPKVIRGHWPWLKPCIPIVANLVVYRVFEVLRPNTWLLFHIDMFIMPLYTIRCQSGPLN